MDLSRTDAHRPGLLADGGVPRVAAIGECMVELREQRDGSLQRGFGGDTLNTAVYLARLGVAVDYVTALGDDPWSDEMLAGWQAEGVGTALVQRLPGRLPGLYIIQTDLAGERRFLYWRDSAAARHVFDHLPPGALDGFDVLYLSGITLSIYAEAARTALFDALAHCRARGGKVVFDTNFRPRGWPDRALARRLYERMYSCADIVLASVEDLDLMDPEGGQGALRRCAPGREVILKLSEPGSLVLHDGAELRAAALPVAGVVDTTAAGDSFAAAYLHARLAGSTPLDAARAGHRLAGLVVRHPGAIIPRSVMTQLVEEPRP